MFKMILFVCVFIFLSQAFAQDAEKIHRDALVVDLHADALYSYFETGRSFEYYSTKGMVDLVRLKQGGVDVQFFALWPDPEKMDKMSLYDQAVAALDTFDNIRRRNPEKMELAVSPADIERIVKTGKLAACLGLEGGAAIDNSLDKLQYFYDRGVRYLSLTWNNSPDWASSAVDENKSYWKGHKGLTEFGKEIIHKMNSIGMMVDVSHSGEQTFWDVIATSSKPIIASHSSVYNICRHIRNLKDDQIKALAKNGGVMFINFYAGYLSDGFEDTYEKARKDATVIQDSLKAAGSDEPFDRNAYIHSKIDPIFPTVKTVCDHIDYVVKLVGDDYVGLGSDFDGFNTAPIGLEDVSKMPAITKELVKRGYSEKSIRKILGGNFMRVFKEVTAGK